MKPVGMVVPKLADRIEYDVEGLLRFRWRPEAFAREFRIEILPPVLHSLV
jgi:hypothetical protein